MLASCGCIDHNELKQAQHILRILRRVGTRKEIGCLMRPLQRKGHGRLTHVETRTGHKLNLQTAVLRRFGKRHSPVRAGRPAAWLRAGITYGHTIFQNRPFWLTSNRRKAL